MKMKQRRVGCINWDYDTLKHILLSCGTHPLKSKLFLINDGKDESDNHDRLKIVR